MDGSIKKELSLILVVILFLLMIVMSVFIKKEKNYTNISPKTSQQVVHNTSENETPKQVVNNTPENEPPKAEQPKKDNEQYSENATRKVYTHNIQKKGDKFYITNCTNTNPEKLLDGDIVTGINEYNFEGLSMEEFKNAYYTAAKECEQYWNIIRDNKKIIIHALNASCPGTDYKVNLNFHDNYIYVSQSSNKYFDRIMKDDIIIAADNSDFQGLSATEIRNIWQSLKNKQDFYCKVKRGNEIIQVLKDN